MAYSKEYAKNFAEIDWSGFKPSPPKRVAEERGKAAYFMPDITPFVSPMSGRVLSSRNQVRHEERGYGVRQCGELNKVEHFDNTRLKPMATNERALERAFKTALEKTGMA